MFIHCNFAKLCKGVQIPDVQIPEMITDIKLPRRLNLYMVAAAELLICKLARRLSSYFLNSADAQLLLLKRRDG